MTIFRAAGTATLFVFGGLALGVLAGYLPFWIVLTIGLGGFVGLIWIVLFYILRATA